MTEPGTPIQRWPQQGDPRPPQKGRKARLIVAILWSAFLGWLVGGLPVITMLAYRNAEGFSQLVWVWVIGLIGLPLVIRWTNRRTRAD
jgi:hypothetical protein